MVIYKKVVRLRQNKLQIKYCGTITLFVLKKKSLYNKRLTNCNFVTLRDLYDDDGNSIIEQKSHILFILGIELLASAIRENEQINAISILDKIVKIVLYADDITIAVSDKKSAKIALKIIRNFKIISGLEKTHDMWLDYVQFGTRKFRVSESKSKELYKRMVLAKATQPTATAGCETCFNTEFFKLDCMFCPSKQHKARSYVSFNTRF